MTVSIIVAADRGGVIGSGNRIPWRLPEDLRFFKRMTMGHHIIMGRKTFQSIGKALPGRVNVVVTRSKYFQEEHVEVVHSLAEAIALAENARDGEAFVIGGGQIYRQALKLASRIYLTRVEASVEGDITFPELGEEWILAEEDPREADLKHEFDYVFQRWERVPESPPSRPESAE